jgi:ribonucleotide reductase alpha subunit
MDEQNASVFRDEMAAICVNQLGVFNSPVWFNCGTWIYDKTSGGVSAFKWDEALGKVVPATKGEDRPQCSACFIQSVEDDMDSIFRWMYDNLGIWSNTPEGQDQAITIIRNGLVNVPMVADQEINLSATLVELCQL